MRVLSIDVGTTSVKAGLIDDDGVGAVEEHPLSLSTPSTGRTEQDPEEWWTATRRVVARLPKGSIDAIAVTGQMQDLIAVSSGRIQRPAILYSDQRATHEHATLTEEFGDAWASAALAPPDATNVAAKWQWLRRHESNVTDATDVVLLGGAAVIVWKLTGRATSDRTTAATTGLYDPRAADWWRPIVEHIGIPVPELVDALAGTLAADVAGELGLPADIPVVHAPGDAVATSMGVLGADSREPYAYLGTSGWVGRFVDVASPRDGVIVLPAEGQWLEVAPILNAGGAVDWVRDLLGCDIASFDRLAAEGFGAGAGVVFLPHLDGVRLPTPDPNASGTLLGVTRSASRADVAAAAYEGVARTLAGLLRHVNPNGTLSSNLAVCGGGARSDVWCQTIADVTGHRVRRVADEHASLRGAASSARRALGVSPLPAAGTMAGFDPRSDRHAIHRNIEDTVVGADQVLAPLWAALHPRHPR
jgi:xylulokinase